MILIWHDRPQIVVATKLDALDEPERLEKLREKAKEDGKQFFEISAVTNKGTKELVFAVSQKLDEIKEEEKIEISLSEEVRCLKNYERKDERRFASFCGFPGRSCIF